MIGLGFQHKWEISLKKTSIYSPGLIRPGKVKRKFSFFLLRQEKSGNSEFRQGTSYFVKIGQGGKDCCPALICIDQDKFLQAGFLQHHTGSTH